MWRKIPYGSTQWSVFFLSADSDTLPHSLNLKRHKIQCDSKCMYVQSISMTHNCTHPECLPDYLATGPGIPGDMTHNEIESPRAQTTSTIKQPYFH